MTLKGFHIVFITVTTLLAIGFGAWFLSLNRIAQAPVYLAGAVFCFAVALGLLAYGVYFYRKMKRLGLIT